MKLSQLKLHISKWRHKHYIDQKTPAKTEYLFYDSISLKFVN